MPFAVIDLIFFGIILFAAIVCMINGFINEIFGKAAPFLSIWISLLLYKNLVTPLETYIKIHVLAVILSFLVFFIISFVIFKIVQQIIKNIFGGHIFLQLDRLLGFVIGLVEGLAVIGIIIIVIVVQPWFPTDSLLDGSFFMRIFSPFLSVPINAISEKITDATAFVQVEKCLTMC